MTQVSLTIIKLVDLLNELLHHILRDLTQQWSGIVLRASGCINALYDVWRQLAQSRVADGQVLLQLANIASAGGEDFD